MKVFCTTLSRTGLVLTLSILPVSAVFAGNTQPAETPAPVTESAVRVYVDPQTGERSSRPETSEQKRAAAAAQPAPDFSKITEVRHADGSTEWQFNGQMMESMVATRDVNGRLVVTCSEHGAIRDLSQHALEHATAAGATAGNKGARDVR